MNEASALVVFLGSAAISLLSSSALVTRLDRIAGRRGLSDPIVGLVVAFAADAPEITSAVTAVVGGNRSIGTGVVVGSNVFNLAALLGLGAITAGSIALHRRVILLEGWPAIAVAAITLGTLASGASSWIPLVAAVIVVVPYLLSSMCSAKTWQRLGLPARARAWLTVAIDEQGLELAEPKEVESANHDRSVAGIALVVVVAASAVMERAASTLGRDLSLPTIITGGVVLAAVTSLPNAVGAVYLARQGRGSALLSEAMNSNMINVVVGLFLPGAIFGLGRPSAASSYIAASYVVLTIATLAAAHLRRGLRRSDGAAIVAAYAVFVACATLF